MKLEKKLCNCWQKRKGKENFATSLLFFFLSGARLIYLKSFITIRSLKQRILWALQINNDSKNIFLSFPDEGFRGGPTDNLSLHVDGKVVAARSITWFLSVRSIRGGGVCSVRRRWALASVSVVGAISRGSPRAVPTLADGPSVGSIKTKESSRLGATLSLMTLRI